MNKRTMILIMGLMAMSAVSVMAATIHVPADQPTIQAGINAAVDGDTVLVAAGVYYVNLVISGKSVSLISEAGLSATTLITYSSGGPALRIESNSGKQVSLKGLTFTGATEQSCVACNSGRLDISENLFYGNSGTGGSVAYNGDCTGIVRNNRFSHNSYDGSGSGLSVWAADSLLIEENVFDSNYALQSGGAMALGAPSAALVRNNLFFHNKAWNYGAVATFHADTATRFYNNTIYGSVCEDGDGGTLIFIASQHDTLYNNILVECSGLGILNQGNPVVADYNDCFDCNNVGLVSGPGSILLDPLFLSPGANFHLLEDSPCINAGNPASEFNDLDGSRNDMGAFPYIAPNERPIIAPLSDLAKQEGDTVSFLVSATDPDSTIPTLTAFNLPVNAVFFDSGNGHGAFYWPIAPKQYGTFNVSFVASDSVLADTETVEIQVSARLPELSNVTVAGSLTPEHVMNHLPTIAWHYFDFAGDDPQLKFEIAVGTDSDWTYAEMWNPAPFNSADTLVVYNGSPLADGATYWLRLRVNNALAWSDWKQISLRMNSIPTLPQLRLPLPGALVPVHQPELVIRNSTDAESDSLLYTFAVSPDSFMTTVYTFTKKQSPDSLTALIVDSVLAENARYWWRVKASDYYESSEYSPVWSFWVNGTNSAPTPFQLILPPDTSGAPLTTLLPQFVWSPSSDPDPLDGVRYSLNIALDANFNFVNTIDALTDNAYTLTADDSLDWGTRYWWKVRAYDYNGGNTWSTQVLTFRTITLGDANYDGEVDISDAVYLIAYIFSGGPAPSIAGDANCDHTIDISDAVYLIAFIFSGGPEPCAAF